MTPGLKFNRIRQVVLSQSNYGADGGTVLAEGSDYTLTVNEDGSRFSVELTAAGLAKLDAVPSASYLYVDFDATVTKDALIGTDTAPFVTDDDDTVDATNQNTAKLTYATDRTSEHDYYSNTCRVYTYEIDLKKNLNQKIHGAEDKSALDLPMDYGAVKFTVLGSNNAPGQGDADEPEVVMRDVIFCKEDDGVYHVYDPVTDGGTYDADADTLSSPQEITKFISPKSDDGTLALKGLDSRDYIFTEVATAEGYQLLEKPFTVRLVANLQGEGVTTKFENGALSHAFVWTGDEPRDLREYDLARTDAIAQLNTGRAPVAIANASVFHVLRTGGTGTVLFVVGGLALLAGAGFWFVKTKKNESEEEQEEEAEDE
jgi:LPXTG-motif cell wall-anchored protein